MDLRGRVETTAYRALVATHRRGPVRARAWWKRAWKLTAEHSRGPVSAPLAGRSMLVPAGDRRPLYEREHPAFQFPVVEAVRLATERTSETLLVIDVGAAVGDTAAIVLDRFGDAIERVVCIEGHPGFFELLERNLGDEPRAQLVQAVLSDERAQVPGLTAGQHAGTARSGAATMVDAVPLDSLLPDIARCDVLKIDTDGFDGRILAGSRGLLARDHPVVVFEWSPLQLVDVDNPIEEAFDVLDQAGYGHFAFFTKVGNPHHTMMGLDHADLATWTAWCLDSGLKEEYFDIIATTDTA